MKLLVTGQAGCGKTTIGEKFRADGVETFDTDTIGWRRPMRPGDVPDYPPILDFWKFGDGEELVDSEALDRVLRRAEDVVVTGIFANVWGLRDRFDLVVWLQVTPETMRTRLNARGTYGVDDALQAILTRNMRLMERWAAESGFLFVDADRPLDQVYNDVRALVGVPAVA